MDERKERTKFWLPKLIVSGLVDWLMKTREGLDDEIRTN